jgi:NADH:ubiquinone oxidoreductase subunit 2 (subunit N)
LDGGQVTLVVLAVLNSALSAAYYLRVLVCLYMKPKTESQAIPAFRGLLMGGTLACVALILVWGLLPGSLLGISSF